MKIGILQTGLAPDELKPSLGDYPEMFAQLLAGHDFEFQTYKVVLNQFPASIMDADGWLITGSKHGAYEDHDWIVPLENLIREIYSAKLPLVGVCFGHQIIAQALGGKVEKFKDGWKIGIDNYQIDGLQAPTALNAWHQDQIVELPKDATVIGSSDFCKYAALAYGDTILTVQPHPEFSGQMIQGLIEHRSGAVEPKALLDDAKAIVDTPTQADQIANMFSELFLKKQKQEVS